MGILDKLSKLIPKKEKELEFDVSPEEMEEVPGDIFGDEFEIEEGGLGEIREEEVSGGGKGEERFEELESKISKLEMTITGMQREQDEVKKSLESINQSMVELLSLYEVVSNQINPFVGDGDKAPVVMEKLDNMEKRINEFEEIVNNIKMDLETKRTEDKSLEFDTLSEAFGTLSEEVDKLSKKISEIEVEIKSEKMESKEVKRENVKENIVITADSVVDSGEVSQTPTKPRLKRIELTPTNVVVLLKWLEFLMERVGRNNLIEVLDFYVEIGWISEEVASTLLSYARGIEYYTEKHEWRLLSDDHTKSLLFIEKLSGNKIDHSTLRRVEREISKLSRGVEEIYGL